MNDHYCTYLSLKGVCEISHKRPKNGEKCPYEWNKALKKADKILALTKPDGTRLLGIVSGWVDAPDRRGDYWVSSFVDGRYIAPHIIHVIDYERPERGLEVQEGGHGDTIPVSCYCKEYRPKAKWLFIPEPEFVRLVKDE